MKGLFELMAKNGCDCQVSTSTPQAWVPVNWWRVPSVWKSERGPEAPVTDRPRQPCCSRLCWRRPCTHWCSQTFLQGASGTTYSLGGKLFYSPSLDLSLVWRLLSPISTYNQIIPPQAVEKLLAAVNLPSKKAKLKQLKEIIARSVNCELKIISYWTRGCPSSYIQHYQVPVSPSSNPLLPAVPLGEGDRVQGGQPDGRCQSCHSFWTHLGKLRLSWPLDVMFISPPPDVAPGSLNDDQHGVEHDAAEHDRGVPHHKPCLHHLSKSLSFLISLPLSTWLTGISSGNRAFTIKWPLPWNLFIMRSTRNSFASVILSLDYHTEDSTV